MVLPSPEEIQQYVYSISDVLFDSFETEFGMTEKFCRHACVVLADVLNKKYLLPIADEGLKVVGGEVTYNGGSLINHAWLELYNHSYFLDACFPNRKKRVLFEEIDSYFYERMCIEPFNEEELEMFEFEALMMKKFSNYERLSSYLAWQRFSEKDIFILDINYRNKLPAYIEDQRLSNISKAILSLKN